MYLLVFLVEGKRHIASSSSKKKALAYVKNGQVDVWRLHDGSGWCDGSDPEVYKHIMGLEQSASWEGMIY